MQKILFIIIFFFISKDTISQEVILYNQNFAYSDSILKMYKVDSTNKKLIFSLTKSKPAYEEFFKKFNKELIKEQFEFTNGAKTIFLFLFNKTGKLNYVFIKDLKKSNDETDTQQFDILVDNLKYYLYKHPLKIKVTEACTIMKKIFFPVGRLTDKKKPFVPQIL